MQTTELTEHSFLTIITAPPSIPTGKSFEFSTHTLELLSFSFYPLENTNLEWKKST